MAQCEHCRKRKAKRNCQALGQSLCPLCCGQLREKEVSCPPDCIFLKTHQPYQEKKTLSKKSDLSETSMSPEQDPIRDERLAWLIFNIEIPLSEIAGKKPDFRDKDALFALQNAREIIQKEKTLILLSDERPLRRDPLAETIVKIIDTCKYERKILMPGDLENYSAEEKLLCLDRIILMIKQLMQNDLASTVYIQQLAQRLSKIQDLTRRQKVLPSS